MLRINCRTVRDLLPLHCGGDLPPDKAVQVDQHLHACLTCFREFREYAAVRGRLGVLAEETLPAGTLDHFTEEVMARITVGEDGPAAALPSARRWTQLDVPALRWAAAAALLLALGWGLHDAGYLGSPSDAAPTLPRRDFLAETSVSGAAGPGLGAPGLVSPGLIGAEAMPVADGVGTASVPQLVQRASPAAAGQDDAQIRYFIDMSGGPGLPPVIKLKLMPLAPDLEAGGLVPDPGSRKRPREPSQP